MPEADNEDTLSNNGREKYRKKLAPVNAKVQGFVGNTNAG